MNYKLIIFDFDGTLADSYPWFLSIAKDLLQQYHLPAMDISEIEKLRTLEIDQILKTYKIPLWKAIIIGNHLKKMMNNQINKVLMVDGIQSVIETLAAQDVRLSIVTSNAEQNVRRVLGQYISYFDPIESGVSIFGKESKFLKILRKTSIKSHEALSIGDEVRDLKSSHAAKIPFGAVSWGYTDRQTLLNHAPETIFDTPGQILEVVYPLRPSSQRLNL